MKQHDQDQPSLSAANNAVRGNHCENAVVVGGTAWTVEGKKPPGDWSSSRAAADPDRQSVRLNTRGGFFVPVQTIVTTETFDSIENKSLSDEFNSRITKNCLK